MKTIAPAELQKLLATHPGLPLLDVRTPVEYAEVHVPQARNVPLDKLSPKTLFDAGQLPKGQPVYLLCRSAFLSAGRVGGAHQLAKVGNGVFFFQGQRDDRSARHEIGERTVEWPAGMHGIKLLRLMLGYFQHLHGENAEAVLLELFNDVADRVPGYGVRLYDGKSSL